MPDRQDARFGAETPTEMGAPVDDDPLRLGLQVPGADLGDHLRAAGDRGQVVGRGFAAHLPFDVGDQRGLARLFAGRGPSPGPSQVAVRRGTAFCHGGHLWSTHRPSSRVDLFCRPTSAREVGTRR
ncbi:hypothetical protein ACQPZ8_20065 [Actinomadura nitritigenes]|uniref:hypothetical protein n=1 Tax=Actinomadura nitritigenes TaxID=134602 RepID=UPI003D8A95A2